MIHQPKRSHSLGTANCIVRRWLLLLLLLGSITSQTAWAVLEPCHEANVASLPFCNSSLSAVDRAVDLVSRLTVDEKISQLMNDAPAIDRFRMDAYNWWNEALHGILFRCADLNDCRRPTSYPMPIGIGATFNMTLVNQMASQIASEGRRLFVDMALANQNATQNHHKNKNARSERYLLGVTKLLGLDFWAPNINIFRDPRWGRGMETPGEDPYLTGQYAIAFVRGMQQGEDSRYLKTVATLKHFAGYSLEGWHQYNRAGFNAIISDQDLVQTYLPAFQDGIQQGKAKSVMCSYNAVNGIPSCADSFLLQDILRDQWRFEGYVVSDCGAIGYVYHPHNYKPTPEQAVSASLQAGTDLNCGNFYQHLKEALKNETLVTEGDLNVALVRLFTTRIQLGLLDDWKQQPYMQYPPETVGHPDHVETALQVARESIVLLKNEGSILPLQASSSSSSLRKLVVMGPHYDATSVMCGTYHGTLPTNIISPFQAIKNEFSVGQVVGMRGCEINSNSTDNFEAAKKLANEADLAILVMGISAAIEAEGKDRESIGFPGNQEGFIQAIAAIQKKTVLVLINGGSLDVSAAKDNPHVVAILEAFYPGMQGGQAIADVLFGKYNPSGRLPFTMHKKDFVDQISFADMSMTNYPGRTYRYFSGEVVFPFGYGLSYTDFVYEVAEMSSSRHRGVKKTDRGPRYRVKVTNTGSVGGDTSVLAFLSFDGNAIDYQCPKSQLFGFEKIYLTPGESKTIFFSAAPSALKCYRTSDNSLGSPAGLYSVRIGEYIHNFRHVVRKHAIVDA